MTDLIITESDLQAVISPEITDITTFTSFESFKSEFYLVETPSVSVITISVGENSFTVVENGESQPVVFTTEEKSNVFTVESQDTFRKIDLLSMTNSAYPISHRKSTILNSGNILVEVYAGETGTDLLLFTKEVFLTNGVVDYFEIKDYISKKNLIRSFTINGKVVDSVDKYGVFV